MYYNDTFPTQFIGIAKIVGNIYNATTEFNTAASSSAATAAASAATAASCIKLANNAIVTTTECY